MCVPLNPGDLLLAEGTFQHYLVHGSLPYTEAGNVDEVLKKFSVCEEARLVLRSRKYQDSFDVDESLGILPDRSVIILRHIENHQPVCPLGRPLTPSAPPQVLSPPGYYAAEPEREPDQPEQRPLFQEADAVAPPPVVGHIGSVAGPSSAQAVYKAGGGLAGEVPQVLVGSSSRRRLGRCSSSRQVGRSSRPRFSLGQ